MYWRRLKYLLSYDPDVSMSKRGSKVRKTIRPAITGILSLANPLKLIIDKKEYKKNESQRPIIYVCSHGFKDDLQNVIATIRDDAYILFGNIDLFYHTFDGIMAWIYGLQLVNRYDKESQHAGKAKMNRMIEYGNNIILFPEATWNLSDNLLILPLHGGFFDVAMKHNALVVPVVTHKVGKKCYTSELAPYDVCQPSEYDFDTMFNKIVQYLEKAENMPVYGTSLSRTVQKRIKELLRDLLSRDGERSQIVEYARQMAEALLADIAELRAEDEPINELESGTINTAMKYLKRVANIRKEVMVSNVRDILATEKYRMLVEHPDNTYDEPSKSIYESWKDYLADTIAGTPFFYPKEESTTIYKDPLLY